MTYWDLSKRQATILDFIKKEIRAKGYPPSVREIALACGLNSPSTVHAHLNTLEERGYLRRDQSKPRALEILHNELQPVSSYQELVDVPILGEVAAGEPMFAEENWEDIFPLPLNYFSSKNELFMLKIKGESMVEAGILNGDFVIVEKCPSARSGEIVVALIDDDATVKTYYKYANYVRLQPENSTMEPLIIRGDLKILGRVIGLVRRY
ncbi:MAG: transcriptional repressor LexA [Clostridiales bacterium]|jgi:repressor LexA|nr:transcriptional repressor LexA [Clostridiales bacterium]MDR2713639.1 transcriptional repressor LexA [Clostridiales bacterium]